MAEESQETESSPVSEEVVTDESTTEVAEDTASPSDATEVEAESETETLESAVQDALGPLEDDPVAEEAEATEETEVTEPIEASEETPSEDYKDVPFNKHPRFRSLVAEKNELKETTAKLQNDSDQYAKIAYKKYKTYNEGDKEMVIKLMDECENMLLSSK